MGERLSATGSVGGKAVVASNRPATLTGWYLFNSNNVPVYLQFFDAADASPNATFGNALPDLSLGIPAGAAANLQGEVKDFVRGVVVIATTTRSGNQAPANPVDFNLFFCE